MLDEDEDEDEDEEEDDNDCNKNHILCCCNYTSVTRL